MSERFYSIVLLILLPIISLMAQQQTVTITSGPEWIDATVIKRTDSGYENIVDKNFSDYPYIAAFAWSHNRKESWSRSLLKFNLERIPIGSTITSATINLNSDPLATHIINQNSTADGSNSILLEKVIESWNETEVTWNNQPMTNPLEVVWVDESSSNFESRQIDLASFVQDWVNNPSANYGMQMFVENETKYRSRTYVSSDHPNCDLRPSLIITYIPPNNYTGNSPTMNELNCKYQIEAETQLSIQIQSQDTDPEDYLILTGFGSAFDNGATLNQSTFGTQVEGTFNWTPDLSLAGKLFKAIVISSDNSGLTSARSFLIEVLEPTNDPPQLSALESTYTLPAGMEFNLDISAHDPNPDNEVTLSVTGPVFSHNADFQQTSTGPSVTGSFTWTPDVSLVGNTYQITITASDGSLTDQRIVNLVVDNPSNRAPNFVAPIETIYQIMATEEFALPVEAMDIDEDDMVTLSMISDIIGYGATFSPIPGNPATGELKWTPSADLVGMSFVVTLTATDIGQLSTDKIFSIEVVTPPNDAPVISEFNEHFDAYAGVDFTLPITATDPNEDDLITLTASGVDVFDIHGAVFTQTLTGNPAEALFSWKPSYAVLGQTFTVTIEANDRFGLTTQRSFTITVKAPPEALFTYKTACDINSATFNANMPGISYTWDFGDGITLTTADKETTHEYEVNGRYQVTLTVNDGGSANTSVEIVDVGSPVAFFTVSDICQGQLTKPEEVADGADSYEWDFGDGRLSQEMNPAHLYDRADTYTITLTITKRACQGTHTEEVQVTEGVDARINVASENLCAGSSVKFDAEASENAETYMWDFGQVDANGNPIVKRGVKANHTYEQPGSYQVTLTAGNGYCKDQAFYYINIAYPPLVEIEKSSDFLCNGGEMQLKAKINNPSPGSAYTYEWTDSRGALIGISRNLGISQAGDYRLTVTNGCGQSEPALITINETGNPTATVNLISGVTCPGLNNGHAEVVLNNPADWVIWHNGTNGTENSELAEGVNYLKVMNDLGCAQELFINIPYEGPIATVQSVPAGCSSGGDGSITVNMTGGSTPFTYQWDVNAGSQTTATASGLGVGSYSVTITDFDNCKIEKSNLQVISPTVYITVENTIACGLDPVEVRSVARYSGDGEGNFTYSWHELINNEYEQVGGSEATNKMPAGQYKVVATENSSGCAGEVMFEVKEGLPVTLTVNSNPVKCFDDTNASAVALATGGEGEYKYQWLDGQTLISESAEIKGLPAGMYKVKAEDERGCFAEVPVDLSTQPEKIVLGQITASSCEAWVDVTPEDTYTFAWIRRKTDENGVITELTDQTTTVPYAIGLTPGFYVVEAVNQNGCKGRTEEEAEVIGRIQSRSFSVQFAYMRPAVKEKEKPKEKVQELVKETAIEMQNIMTAQLAECAAMMQYKSVADFEDKCLKLDQFEDKLTIEYALPQYHYTLYYYDRAGQLTKTVPPEGVQMLTDEEVEAIMAFRYQKKDVIIDAPPQTLPEHGLATTYQYNGLSQLIRQNSPDGGTTNFIYNDATQLRFSQNAKQKVENTWSYTKYDKLGRITEVGQGTDQAFHELKPVANNLIYPSSGTTDLTVTRYTESAADISYYGQGQRYLNNRVSYSFTDVDGDLTTTDDRTATYYSYDPHGNVEWLRQDIPGFAANYIKYEYDLISGNVLKVKLNEYRKDRMFHRYQYDADNRLLLAETSINGELWDRDASYEYYIHGPLRRVQIGEDKIQGIDYAYTIQGWLKGINHPELNPNSDPGNDGANNYLKDVFGMSLGYYQGDYNRKHLENGVLKTSPFNNINNFSNLNLYNGNISSWATQTDESLNPEATPFKNQMTGRIFTYDKLNRIRTSALKYYDNNQWNNSDAFATSYTYDGNGNLQTLNRKSKDGGAEIDQFTYLYEKQDGRLAHNRLLGLRDESTHLDNGKHGDLFGENTDTDRRFTYDAIGNLISETGKEKINNQNTELDEIFDTESQISWNVYGKVKSVVNTSTARTDGGVKQREVYFTYDAAGNRVKKEVIEDQNNPTVNMTTYYVRDASGNIMATYERRNMGLQQPVDGADFEAVFYTKERPIYGSDRIGQVAYEEEIYRVPFSSNLQETALSFNLDKREGISGYKNWISPANKLINTLGGDNWDSHIKLIGFANGAYSSVDLASEMIGYSGNNIAVAEDMEGTLQFISAIPETHSGHKNICLIYDRTGRLMKNSHKIRSDAQAKPIVLKQQGANEIYYLFTIGENQRPYYHVIDMGMNGFAKANEKAMGMVTEKNNPMDETSSYRYGYHMALIEDHLTGSGILYMTRYIPSPSPDQPGNTEIVAFDFSGDAAVPAPFVVTRIPGYDLKGLGELQISADGKKLAYYNRQKSVAGFAHQLVEINLITLSEDRKSALNIVKVDGSQGGTYGKSSVEVAQSGDDVYFNQWGVYKLPENQTEKNVFRYRLNTAASQLTSAPYGELRRGSDGKLYVASQGQDHSMYTIEEGEDGAITIGESPVAAAGLGYELSGNLPSQPYRLSGEHETYFHRLTSAKHYELKDHLGNVRAVVGDQRGAKIDNGTLINYPEVLTYSDYYPFGMAMHGRTYNFGDYRYGFNGKEKDDKGEWGSTAYDYGFRIYNPQIAKFLSVDPLMRDYPWNSTYAFAENDVIRSIDIEGLEKYIVIYSPEQALKVETAIKNKDWKEVNRIIQYASVNGFVGKNGKPSDFMIRKLAERGNNDLPKNNSTTLGQYQKGEREDLLLFTGAEVDENFRFARFKYLGQIDLALEKQKAINERNLEEWHRLVKENPSEYIEDYRTIMIKELRGDNIPAPRALQEFTWPEGGTLGGINFNMNRTDHLDDLTSMYEFIEDYKKNPDKYRNAVHDYVRKVYGKHIDKMLEDSKRKSGNKD